MKQAKQSTLIKPKHVKKTQFGRGKMQRRNRKERENVTINNQSGTRSLGRSTDS